VRRALDCPKCSSAAGLLPPSASLRIGGVVATWSASRHVENTESDGEREHVCVTKARECQRCTPEGDARPVCCSIAPTQVNQSHQAVSVLSVSAKKEILRPRRVLSGRRGRRRRKPSPQRRRRIAQISWRWRQARPRRPDELRFHLQALHTWPFRETGRQPARF